MSKINWLKPDEFAPNGTPRKLSVNATPPGFRMVQHPIAGDDGHATLPVYERLSDGKRGVFVPSDSDPGDEQQPEREYAES